MDDALALIEVCSQSQPSLGGADLVRTCEKALLINQREYCPPLDAALVTAICLDFDLDTQHGYRDARALLDQLRVSAEEEGEIFDPSGTGGRDIETNVPLQDNVSADIKSLSNGISGLSASDWSSETTGNASGSSKSNVIAYGMSEEERMPLEQQVEALLAIFPSAKEYSVRHILKKCDGNWNRAMDELLNQQFLSEPGSEGELAYKGIEAFSGGAYGQKTNKKNRRNRRRDRTQLDSDHISHDPSSTSPAPVSENVWNTSKEDIAFIISRTEMPYKMVASLYRSHAASVPATIIAILESPSIEEHFKAPEDDTIVQVNAVDLGHEFPSVAHQHLVSLVRLTHPSTATAHELAREMTKVHHSFASGKASGGLEVIPSYAPINLSDNVDDQPWTAIAGRKQIRSLNRSDQDDAAALASHYDEQQSRAFAQAAAAYRRGKSDHLMGAAAGYYSQIGRDMASKKRDATAGAADALVASQSAGDTIDLHGVSVTDAVRIARAKTEDWWRGRRGVMGLDGRLGEMTGGNGFKIITGLGRHSAGGIGKLGPAVGRMLFNEGWRVVVDEGVYTVLGKRR